MNNNERVRILFVQHSSSIGGASWCLLGILRNINRDQFDPTVALLKHGPLADQIDKLGIPVIVLDSFEQFRTYEHRSSLRGMLVLLRFALKYYRTFRTFSHFCKKQAPSIVYLNSLALLTMSWPAKAAGVQTVCLHNREHWEPHGIMKIKNPIKNWFVSNYVDHVIHITEVGKLQFGDFEKSIVIRDWPFFDDISIKDVRSELGIPPSKSIILLPGGMQSIKGSKEVLDALQYMRHAERVAILILGCKSVKLTWWRTVAKFVLRRGLYPEKITRMANRNPWVFLLPHTLNVKAYIDSANVVVCPFLVPHAAKAALEAQFLSKPVVVYDSAEAREYVQDGKTGIIVEHRNICALAAALDKLVEDETYAKILGSRGYEFVHKEFSGTNSMNKLNSILLHTNNCFDYKLN